MAMALLCVKRFDDALVAARRAFQLDGASAKTQYVLGCTLVSINPQSVEGT
jgi:hypothetical protein